MKQFKRLKVSESLRKFGKKMQKSLKVLLFWIFVVYIKLTVKLCFEHALQKKNYTEHFFKGLNICGIAVHIHGQQMGIATSLQIRVFFLRNQ